MPNNILTHQLIAREAAAILMEEAPFLANINMARESEFASNVRGAKAGQSVTIRVPGTFRVFDGAQFAGGGQGDDAQEQAVTLTLGQQRHVPISFTMRERTLNVTEFNERVLRPAMMTLSSVVEADFIGQAMRTVPNAVGTWGTVPAGMITYAQARERLQNFLAPPSNRTTLFSSAANVNLTDQTRQLFNPVRQSERAFLRGSIGEAQGAEFFEHQSIALHTNGNQASWTVNGASQTGTTLNIGTLTATQTITAGTIFTIAGVNAVHPLTGVDMGFLQQFVVTANFTASGTTGAISIFPAITTAMPNRTVTASPAGGAACTLFGTASQARRQNLMFQRDAFSAAFVPLEVPAGTEGYTATLPNGISVRVYSFPDGINDRENTRIDVLGGITAVRPLHACRITE